MARYEGTDALDAAADEYGPGGLFVQLEDGDDIEGVFLGQPEGADSVFNPRTNRWEDHDATNPDHEGLDVSLRIKWNFYDRKFKAVRIFTLTRRNYKRVRTHQEKKGKNSWFYVQRTGDDKETTKWKIRVIGSIEEGLWNDLLGLDLNALTSVDDEDDDGDDYGLDSDRGGDGGSADEASDDAEWDADKLHELKLALNTLSETDFARFREEFGVERTSDLAPSAATDAWAFIKAVHDSKDQTTDGEVDPFAAR